MDTSSSAHSVVQSFDGQKKSPVLLQVGTHGMLLLTLVQSTEDLKGSGFGVA